MRARRVERFTLEKHRSLIGAQHAGQHIKKGGLACAIGTNQGVHMPARHFQVQVVERIKATEALGEPLGPEANRARVRLKHWALSSAPEAAGARTRGSRGRLGARSW